MKTTALILILMLTLVMCSTSLAQGDDPARPAPLVLTDEQGEYPLGRNLAILEDPSGKLTIEDVTSPELDSQFVPSQVEVPNYGFTNSAYWVRLRLRNKTRLTDRWLLELGFANMNFADLYTPLPDGEGFAVKQTGNLRPPATRDFSLPHIVFDLTVPPQSEQQVYLRFQNGPSMTLPLTLWSPADFLTRFALNQALVGLYFGILIGLLGYNLFFLISLRDASHVYLVLLLASRIVNDAAHLGYIQSYLAPNLYNLSPSYIALSFPLFCVSTLLFADAFLELKTTNPRLHRLTLIMVAVWGVLVLLVPFTTYHALAILIAPWSLVSLATPPVAGIVAWQRGFRPARYYLIAWFGMIATLIVGTLVRLGAIPSTQFSEHAYQFGVVWLAVGWSMALADRVNLLKAETEDANRALRSSEHRLSRILEGLPLGVVVYGKDQRPNFANRRVIEILSNPARGIGPDPAAPRTLEQAMKHFSFRVADSDQEYPLESMPVYRALKGEPASADDIEADLVDKRVPLEIWASPVIDDSGDVESVLVALQDITRRKNNEAELAEYRYHLESLVEQRTAQLNHEVAERKSLAETQLRLIEWLSAINEIHKLLAGAASLPQVHEQLLVAISQLLGAKSALIGMRDSQSEQIQVLHCLWPDDSAVLVEEFPVACETDSPLRRVIEQGELLILPAEECSQTLPSLKVCLQDAEILSVILAPIKAVQGVIGLLVLGMPRRADSYTDEEITLFERIELDLARLTEYARLYDTARTLAAAEERNRLARDLHDSVTQMLFSAVLVAEVLPKIWRRDPERALRSLERLRRLTHGALAEMRTMLLELRPAALVNTPLGELLAQLTEAVTTRIGLPLQLSIDRIPSLPEAVHISFYRIAQEALNNVVKYAQASLVTVSLSAMPLSPESSAVAMNEITMVIQDDGVGYASAKVGEGHLGMGIMRERAAAVQATLILESRPAYGTRVTLIWCDKSGVDHE